MACPPNFYRVPLEISDQITGPGCCRPLSTHSFKQVFGSSHHTISETFGPLAYFDFLDPGHFTAQRQKL